MNYDEAYEGAYVVHPDFNLPAPPVSSGRYAYLNPPLIGVLTHILADLSGKPRIGRVSFPGVGVRDLGILELTHASHWLIDRENDSASFQREANAEARNFNAIKTHRDRTSRRTSRTAR